MASWSAVPQGNASSPTLITERRRENYRRVLLISTETSSEPSLATARSVIPSPLRSATPTEVGRLPVPKLPAGWKPPSPSPKYTETLLEPKLPTTRSGTPSPLKSPTATEDAERPAPKLRAAWKLPSPLPNSTETVEAPELATARTEAPSPLKPPP